MIYILFVFVLVTSVFARDPTDKCVLDIQPSSSCDSANWDGFFNSQCCEPVFEEYLFALAKHTNQTGSLFLNSTQQQSCRPSLEGSNGRNLLSCGVEKLASGLGSCSDFSLNDVANKLKISLAGLEQDCEVLESSNGCNSCFERWLKIGEEENEICQFATLVSMTSRKSYNSKWVRAVYQCLGYHQNESQNLENDHQEHKKKMSIGELILTPTPIIANQIYTCIP